MKSVLEEFRYIPGIGIHWINMGSNGRLTRPETGGFLRHYTRCNPAPAATVKVIVNTYFVQSAGKNPHSFVYRYDAAKIKDYNIHGSMMFRYETRLTVL